MTHQPELQQLDGDGQRLLGFYRTRQYTALLHEVDELSKRGPLSAAAQGMASLACSELERYSEAANAAGMALQQQPAWAWLYHALAMAEAGRGRLREAVAAQSRAVALAPAEPAYPTALARYQRESGWPEDAAKTARQALLAHPEHPGALNELGLALQAAGDPEGAFQQFRMAQSVGGDDPEPWISEGNLQAQQGDCGQARHCYHEALRRAPGLTAAEDRLADTLTGGPGIARRLLLHLLNLGRVTMVGWMMISFLYYVTFRLLQILWRLLPILLPVAQGLLVATLLYLLIGLAAGRSLRAAFRLGWPR